MDKGPKDRNSDQKVVLKTSKMRSNWCRIIAYILFFVTLFFGFLFKGVETASVSNVHHSHHIENNLHSTSLYLQSAIAGSLIVVIGYFGSAMLKGSPIDQSSLPDAGDIKYQQHKISKHSKPLLPSNTTSTLKFLTYNIFLRPPLVKNNADDFKEERFAGFLHHLEKYDIVALQEMFALGNTRQRRLVQRAERLGFNYVVSKPSPWYSPQFIDAGLVIMSKYPIVASDGHIYRHGNQIDWWCAKQVLYAKIQLSEDFGLHVFTTHMQATYNDSSAHHNTLNDKCRNNQVRELAEFVRSKTKGCNYPVVIAGDFNINAKQRDNHFAESEEYLELMRELNSTAKSDQYVQVIDMLKYDNEGIHLTTYADICPQTKKARETKLTHQADLCTQECIDYIFFIDSHWNGKQKNKQRRPHLQLESKSTRLEEFFVHDPTSPVTQLSDHYGVTSNFVLHA